MKNRGNVYVHQTSVSNVEIDQAIIKEHDRLWKAVMFLTPIRHNGAMLVSRDAVLKLLQLTEPGQVNLV